MRTKGDYTMSEVKVWNQEEIKEKLVSGNRMWVEHGVVAIFNKQTESEKHSDETHHLNGVGYNGTDARIMSSFAKWLISGKNHHLSDKQFTIAHKKIVKYSKQLTKIANGEL